MTKQISAKYINLQSQQDDLISRFLLSLFLHGVKLNTGVYSNNLSSPSTWHQKTG